MFLTRESKFLLVHIVLQRQATGISSGATTLYITDAAGGKIIFQSFFMQSAAATAACGECVIKQLTRGLFKTTLSSLDSEATTLTFFFSPVKRVVPILGTCYLVFWQRSYWESGIMPASAGCGSRST